MIILFIFLNVVFLIEGLGILYENFFIDNVFLLLISAMFLFVLKKKKYLFLPPKLTAIFIVFLIFSLISSLNFSIDKQASFEGWLKFLALFLVFVFFYNFKERGRILIRYMIYILTILYSVFFLIKNFLSPQFLSVIPRDTMNLFYSFYNYNHNHLGDLMGAFFVLFFFKYCREKINFKKILIIVFSLVMVFFSWSRSAYLSLFVVFLLIGMSAKKIHLKSVVMIAVPLVFFLLVSGGNKMFQQPWLISKTLFSGRNYYYYQGIKAFLERPVFGYGFNNFSYTSGRYQLDEYAWTDNPHGYWLYLLSGGGLFTTIIFFSLIFLVLRAGFKKKDVYFYLLIYFFINFQTDYTHLFNSLHFLFFTLMAVNHDESEEAAVSPAIFGITALILILAVQLIVLSRLFIKLNKPETALRFYPFSKEACGETIKNLVAADKQKEAEKIINHYFFIAPENRDALIARADYFERLGNKRQALYFYEKAYQKGSPPLLSLFIKTYSLKKELRPETLNQFVNSVFDDYRRAGRFSDKNIVKQMLDFCIENNESACDRNGLKPIYFYEPKKNSAEKTNKDLPYQAVYSFNDDGLHERFDYPRDKQADSYRILILGDAHAFGFLVNTKDNWTEKLEEALNYQQSITNNQKYEVINLAYHSYDLTYQVERYRLRGKKYQPDLIIWLNNDFYRINELFLPIVDQIDQNIKQKGGVKKYQKQGQYFPVWERAYEEYKKQIEETSVLGKQKAIINKFFDIYQGSTVFISFYDVPEELRKIFVENKALILELKDFPYNKNYFFEKINSINPTGHQQLANLILFFLQQKELL